MSTIQGTNGDDLLDFSTSVVTVKINGGDGNDTLIGGDGIDKLQGGNGNDSIDGGAGNDKIEGNAGNDQLDGGSGDDVVNGGDGNDYVAGGSGNDTLAGEKGNDTVEGGDGTDTAVFAGSVLDFQWTEPSANEFIFTDLNVSDGNQGTDAVKKIESFQFDDLIVFVDGTNNAPFVDVEANETDEDTVLAFGVNAYDFDGDNLTLAAFSFSGAGTLTQTTTTPLSPAMGTGEQYGFTFDPGQDYQYLAAGEEVVETLTVTVDDDQGGSSTYTIDITVTGLNDAPVALAVSAAVNEDGPTVDIAADFTDVDATDTHTFTIDTSGTVGTVTNNNDSTFTYDPAGQFEHLAAGETAEDTFTYTVDDNNGGIDTETVTVTVAGQNDAPDAFGGAATANEAAGLFTIDLNDYVDDPDLSDTLVFTNVSIGRGLVPFTKNGGLISFNPSVLGLDDGEFIVTELTFTATDPHGASDLGIIELTINGADDPGPGSNNPPVANDFAVAADEADGDLTIDLTPHISDPDGDTLTVLELTADGFEITFTQDGNEITFDPSVFGLNLGQQGVFDITYVIDDGTGASNSSATELESASDTETFIESNLQHLSKNVAATSTVNSSGVLRSVVTFPSTDLQTIGRFPGLNSVQITVAAEHLIEDFN